MADAHQEDIVEITPEMKTMLMKNYFFVNKVKFPSFFAGSVFMAYLFMGLAIFVILYFEKVLMTYLFATLLVVVAFFYTFRWFTPYFSQKQKYAKRPSTDQMENWLIKDIRETVKPMAIDMLSLNPATITPENFIVVPHPVFWEVSDVPKAHITGQDAGDYKVYATYKIQVLALSENYVSFYTCVYNWLDNQVVYPYTLEFFFDDISSITAENQILDLTRIDAPPIDEEAEEDDGIDRGIGGAQTVIVRNKSGETMNIIVNIPTLESSPRSTLKPEKVMQTLRIMLRNRRYGEEFEIVRPDTEE
ncbi:MAG: hypothetical protein JXL97_18320 [Bacteroidales bacterium]|nr:hypothetical protein [Bacteroidales bacterium]